MQGMSLSVAGTNWSGNYVYRAEALHRPATLEELQEVVARAPQVHALGSRHSFTDITDSAELVSLDALEGELTVDHGQGTASVPAGMTYAQLAEALNREGLALQNMASLPHISVAGAVATATHGSGVANGNLATAVVGLELVTSSGQVIRSGRGDTDFDGLVVGLGALGVITRVTLIIEPFYEMRQRVFEGLAWEKLFENFDTIMAGGDSVSVFHRFGDRTEQVWVKTRVTGAEEVLDDLFGARPARSPLNPVPGAEPAFATEQLGVPGPWSERLPHFRSGFTPSSGEEIQSEFFVAPENAVSAIQAVRELSDHIAPLLFVSELRTIAVDDLWMSPQYGRASVGIHFTWHRRQPEVERTLAEVEAVLAPFDARPHWGKLFTARAAQIAPLYERLEDFRRLRDELDPRGAFRNHWLSSRVLGDS
jgi:xylitol oxidase